MMKKQIINSIFGILFLFLILFFSFVSAEELKVTLEHPFYVNGTWISASEINIGDELQTINGQHVRIKNITDVETKTPFFVYNFEDTFGINNYVVGTDKIIVHNSDISGVCFSGDTLITMADGTKKSFFNVSIGDRVLAFNFQTNMTESVEVLEMEKHNSSVIYLINNHIKVTKEHPFYLMGKGWAAIDNSPVLEHPELILSELKVGDCMMLKNQSCELISSIEFLNETIEVYNLVDLGNNHNYFAEGVLVHNQGNICSNLPEIYAQDKSAWGQRTPAEIEQIMTIYQAPYLRKRAQTLPEHLNSVKLNPSAERTSVNGNKITPELDVNHVDAEFHYIKDGEEIPLKSPSISAKNAIREQRAIYQSSSTLLKSLTEFNKNPTQANFDSIKKLLAKRGIKLEVVPENYLDYGTIYADHHVYGRDGGQNSAAAIEDTIYLSDSLMKEDMATIASELTHEVSYLYTRALRGRRALIRGIEDGPFYMNSENKILDVYIKYGLADGDKYLSSIF